MSGHDHDHDHEHSELSETQLRVRARFDCPELWGADGDPTVKISVDAWEPYLEPA